MPSKGVVEARLPNFSYASGARRIDGKAGPGRQVVDRRKFIFTTDSKHGLHIYPNLAKDMVLTDINQLSESGSCHSIQTPRLWTEFKRRFPPSANPERGPPYGHMAEPLAGIVIKF